MMGNGGNRRVMLVAGVLIAHVANDSPVSGSLVDILLPPLLVSIA